MSTTKEYRVRPVQRFVLTCYQEDGPLSGSTVIGEFPNAESAEAVKASMEGFSEPQGPGVPRPDREHVVIGGQVGEVGAMVFYAYSEKEAEETRASCEAKYGGPFQVFSRPYTSTQPVIAQ